jgi:hypothetical protein
MADYPISTNSRAGVHQKREGCRACGDQRLRAFLTLGSSPLANAWKFADEIVRQQEIYKTHGDNFIIPIPNPKVL